MTTQAQMLVEAAKEVLRQAGYYVDTLWHSDDIRFICEQLELPSLAPHEIQEVFAIVHAQFDGDSGLSWPQLERAVQSFFLQKRTLQAMCALESSQ